MIGCFYAIDRAPGQIYNGARTLEFPRPIAESSSVPENLACLFFRRRMAGEDNYFEIPFAEESRQAHPQKAAAAGDDDTFFDPRIIFHRCAGVRCFGFVCQCW